MTFDDAIESWLPLVRWLASDQRQLHIGYHFDDRVQDGMIAVWRALRSYEPGHGATLDTWVSTKIRRYMLDGSIRETGRGGGGYTYGHVSHLHDNVARDKNESVWAEKFAWDPPDEHDAIEEAFARVDEERRTARLYRAIDSVRDGDVIRARLAGVTLREIGAGLGISESGAQLRWKAAVAEVRWKLAPIETVEPPPAPRPRPRPRGTDAQQLGLAPDEHAARMHDFWAWFEEQKQVAS